VANLEALAIAYQDSGKNEEAIDCFIRTKMDILVLHNYVIRRIK